MPWTRSWRLQGPTRTGAKTKTAVRRAGSCRGLQEQELKLKQLSLLQTPFPYLSLLLVAVLFLRQEEFTLRRSCRSRERAGRGGCSGGGDLVGQRGCAARVSLPVPARHNSHLSHPTARSCPTRTRPCPTATHPTSIRRTSRDRPVRGRPRAGRPRPTRTQTSRPRPSRPRVHPVRDCPICGRPARGRLGPPVMSASTVPSVAILHVNVPPVVKTLF